MQQFATKKVIHLNREGNHFKHELGKILFGIKMMIYEDEVIVGL